jgi:hypothetical protein
MIADEPEPSIVSWKSILFVFEDISRLSSETWEGMSASLTINAGVVGCEKFKISQVENAPFNMATSDSKKEKSKVELNNCSERNRCLN